MNKRVRVNQLQCSAQSHQGRLIATEEPSALQAKNRPQALAPRKDGVPHCLMDGIGIFTRRRKHSFKLRVHKQPLLFEVLSNRGGRRCAQSCSGSSDSNGSATTLPPAFFIRISIRPSASSSCLWQTSESFMPSS